MNLTYTQFQALSSCEAQSLQQAVGRRICDAFESGMNLMLNANMRIDDLPAAMVEALIELGFDDVSARHIAFGIRLSISNN